MASDSAPAAAHPSAPVPDTLSDAELVARMKAGDERALGVFYDRWYPAVSALVARMVNSAEDVEDVVEETFWQAWRQSDRFSASRGAVATWLLTIGRSRALDRLRSIRRRREEALDDHEGSSIERAAANSSGAGDAFGAASSDPSRDVEQDERRRLVLAALGELPREQREALELGYFGGLTQSEIAERTGQPLGTVKTRMRLAMMKLRDRLSMLRDDGTSGTEAGTR
jgi:RNA polymerase sigma-70 factor (ECF subfamily)